MEPGLAAGAGRRQAATARWRGLSLSHGLGQAHQARPRVLAGPMAAGRWSPLTAASRCGRGSRLRWPGSKDAMDPTASTLRRRNRVSCSDGQKTAYLFGLNVEM